MKRLLILAILSLSFSCNNLNVQRKNTERDKVEGEKVLNTYFDNLASNKREDNLKLFSEVFFEKTPKDTFLKQDSIVGLKLGKIIERNLLKWETNIIEGRRAISEYVFIYDVKREKYNTKETFYLIKEPTDSIRIHTYQVESEGLLAE
ncbi:hypothetical protein SAMN05421741_1202 [Paenimyroides ummariense]|uniref:DUF4440 domain-containing protein n=1 Tax=Paenimyroides ummariense TaxID=913024 RepID=A0A1I5ED46_9FLAO|nr:hypothetical protein [Paenimyroides ummariense]SFO09310.1 hypothetical protein SAMN05421741_1202 [Paenimyroides ummariense]